MRRGLGKFAQRARYSAVTADAPKTCRECGRPVTAHFSGPCRSPYVGEGADGARKSAQIDIEESHTLDSSDPRVEVLRESARRWNKQADVIEAVRS